MKRTNKPTPIGAEEAASLLQSAVSYLQLAGLVVKAQNTPGALVLEVPRLCYSVTGEGVVKFDVVKDTPEAEAAEESDTVKPEADAVTDEPQTAPEVAR